MSTTENAARVLKSLKDEEWRTLAGLERATSGYGPPDLGRIARMSRLPLDRVRFATNALEKKGLAMRKAKGYVLTREGVEVMALKDYVKKDLIFALGAVIAKGKESDVYEALTEEGTVYALKLYKIGRVSFTNIRKKRVIEGAEIKSWMTANYDAARREYDALRKLGGLSSAFPMAIAYSRSTVLMDEVSGVRLSQRPELGDPAATLRKIIGSMRTAFSKGGLVNADLSEYNILTDGASVWLIDWPQAVGASHPNSMDLLMHDVRAVTAFFRRAYGVDMNPEKVFDYVSGKSSTLE
jgi:RIO kinase 2